MCVCVCVLWPCGHWTNKLTRLPSVPSLLCDLCSWFCPLSSDSSGCSQDSVWQTSVKLFDWCLEVNQPSISCLDFFPSLFLDLLDTSLKNKLSAIRSWFLLDLLLLACRNNTVPLCCCASDSISFGWVLNYTVMKRGGLCCWSVFFLKITVFECNIQGWILIKKDQSWAYDHRRSPRLSSPVCINCLSSILK